MKNRFLLATLLTLALAATPLANVLAHGDEPRLEISAERLSPGATLELRGVDFPGEESIQLTLSGSGVTLDLGAVTTDVEGLFLYLLVLPADLPEGSYIVMAAAVDHAVVSPAFNVSGPPVLTEEADGERDDEDPLLAPMPTLAAAASAIPPAPLTNSQQPASTVSPRVLLIWLMVVGAALALVSRLRRPR